MPSAKLLNTVFLCALVKQEVEGIDTVKKIENHPIEQFWQEYKRKREHAAEVGEKQGTDPTAVSPASGQLDNVNFKGRYQSQQKKQ